MKIYINRYPVSGPWGGGNKTLVRLVEKLKQSHEVVFDLCPGIDLIFCFDPRPNNKGVWYRDFINYKSIFKNCKIIQRVGDVGTHSKPELNKLLKDIVTSFHTDHFIFPSAWSKYMINHNQKNFDIIFNAADDLFYNHRSMKLNSLRSENEINIVTHHWSNNKKKGFDMYEKLGFFCLSEKIQGRKINFNYYGRYCKNSKSKGINIFKPENSENLSKLLPKYDFYLTASKEEAGANHVLESMACGLPVLYRVGGGSITEYCSDYGQSFENFEDLINLIGNSVKTYDKHVEKVLNYDNKISKMIDQYISVINKVCKK